MIIEQFLINKAKEIDNPISNWGIGFTAEVIREWIDLQVKVKKLIIADVVDTSVCDEPNEPIEKCKCCKSFHEPDVCCYD